MNGSRCFLQQEAWEEAGGGHRRKRRRERSNGARGLVIFFVKYRDGVV
jgi:hypothetical protein